MRAAVVSVSCAKPSSTRLPPANQPYRWSGRALRASSSSARSTRARSATALTLLRKSWNASWARASGAGEVAGGQGVPKPEPAVVVEQLDDRVQPGGLHAGQGRAQLREMRRDLGAAEPVGHSDR